MEIVAKVARMRAVSGEMRRKGKLIALVPTMGALHEGHLSLVRIARDRGAEAVVSIFVNPAQFGPGEDFDRYPRDLTRDAELLVKEGVRCIFAPSVEEMYPKGHASFVDVEGLTDVLGGAARPGHFRGVCTIVMKLFHVVRPHLAIFGWKDAQQLIVIKRMVEDLNVDVEIVGAPTVRESDGVAASSRNAYLDEKGRQVATAIHGALQEAIQLVGDGERSPQRIEEAVRTRLEATEHLSVDHVGVVNAEDLSPMKRLEGLVLVAVAATVKTEGRPPTALIDNVRIEVEDED